MNAYFALILSQGWVRTRTGPCSSVDRWSDYVFDVSYRPQPLSEVAAYIQANHHLPDIPAAKEIQSKGADLGDMQAKLLAKVEELTLYMIDAERENRDLRDRIARLEAGQSKTGAQRGAPNQDPGNH
jgi:hypothetical protein